MFFWIYFAMTGMHAVHMIIGIGVMLVIALFIGEGQVRSGVPLIRWKSPVSTGTSLISSGFFCFPLLYLLGRHMEHLG